METKGIYFYILHENGSCVIKLVRDVDWGVTMISGDEPYELPYEFDGEYDDDDILSYFVGVYDYVVEIEESDIVDFI